MRILLANPNTTEAVTEAMAATARATAAAGTEIKPATARFGAQVIGTRSEMAIAEHACLSLLAAEAQGCDAVIVAASLDSAVRAAREMLAVPVIGLTEAVLQVALMTGVRFGAVTTSGRSAATLQEMIELYGFERRCAGIAGLDTTPLAILADPDAMRASISRAVSGLVAKGADVVVLIGAVMAGMPERLAGEAEVPLLEGVSCAVVLAEGLARLRLPKARAGSLATLPPRVVKGLDAPLAARFSG